MSIVVILLFVLIGIAFYTDVTKSRIPNLVTLGATAVGLSYHLMLFGADGIVFSFLGMTVGAGSFFLLYLFGGVGAGDVKLFGGIGALSGIEFVLYCSIYSILYAGGIGILLLIFHSRLRDKASAFFLQLMYHFRWFVKTQRINDQAQGSSSRIRFPFMWAVLPGFLTAIYYVGL